MKFINICLVLMITSLRTVKNNIVDEIRRTGYLQKSYEIKGENRKKQSIEMKIPSDYETVSDHEGVNTKTEGNLEAVFHQLKNIENFFSHVKTDEFRINNNNDLKRSDLVTKQKEASPQIKSDSTKFKKKLIKSQPGISRDNINPKFATDRKIHEDFEEASEDDSVDRQDFQSRFDNPSDVVGGEDSLAPALLGGGAESLQEVYERTRGARIESALTSGDPEKIAEVIAESKDDPFTLLPSKLKYHELLGADLYFNFLTKMMGYFVLASLVLPALVPILTILSLGAELLAIYVFP